MAKDRSEINFENVFSIACELPYCKIDREEYLTKELKSRVSPLMLMDALENGTVIAKIPMNILDSIAEGTIALETSKVTIVSTAAGIPGGLAMLGTIPADLVQFYAHVIRITQKLAYVYGSKEIDLTDGTQNVLMLYLGVMFGVNAASAALTKFAAEKAAKIGAKIAAKPLTKLAAYNVSKKILAFIGVQLTKDSVGNVVSKSIPVLGGFVSGGLTIATYLPMARKLQKELSKIAIMSPEELSTASDEADVIIGEFVNISDKFSLGTQEDY